MKKWLVVLILFLLAAGGGAWWFFGRTGDAVESGEASAPPETVEAVYGKLYVVVEATGRVVPEEEVAIKCKASGEVVTLPVDVSDRIEKGQLLLQLDPEEEERNVRRAEVSLAVSEARLAQQRLDLKIAERDLESERLRAEAALASAEAARREASAKLERIRQLRGKEMASQEELDSAESAMASADAGLENARARVADLASAALRIEALRQDIAIAEAQVETDRLSLSDARQRLEDTTILAPMGGVVTSREVQIGQIIASAINNVGGGTTVLTLADLSRRYVLVSVDESDIGRIETGQRAAITVDAYPERAFRGAVVRVAAKGTVSSNVVTFEVKVEVTGPGQDLLKPEMTANVEIVVADRDEALLVPVTAVTRRRGKSLVTIQNPDGTTEERPVTAGMSDGDSIEILEGLEAGTTIVLGDAAASGRWRAESEAARAAARNQRRADRVRARMAGGGH